MEYLALDGWKEFQPLRGKGSWIKDATDQSVKPKLCGLSIFTDGVLQRLRRLRGRTGKNIPYDLGYIARSIHAEATDRPHLRHALDTLIARGVLVVTNEELDSTEAGEKEIENEKENKPSARKARGSLKPTDPRFQHCVDILHRYWDKFIKGKVRFEVWMDLAGYRQLKNSLRRSEALTVEDFTRCVANRARSPGVDHCEPAYKWLGHVTEWAGGPKENGRGQAGQVSKAAAREQRILSSSIRVAAAGAGAGQSANPLALPGDGST